MTISEMGKNFSHKYIDYIKSTQWRERRQLALREANHRCQICNSDKRLDVHHRTYENFGNEQLGDLTVLCRNCHNLYHGKEGERPAATPLPQKRRVKIPIQIVRKVAREMDHYDAVKQFFLEPPSRVWTEVEIYKLRSVKGGWTKKTLKEIGVPWPPPRGWKDHLMGLDRP